MYLSIKLNIPYAIPKQNYSVCLISFLGGERGGGCCCYNVYCYGCSFDNVGIGVSILGSILFAPKIVWKSIKFICWNSFCSISSF